ncbi:LytR C-terminal domain-containing protein [Modestobacter sp. URMC 112]
MPRRSRAERRREGLLPPGEDPVLRRAPATAARPATSTPPGGGRRRGDQPAPPRSPATGAGAPTGARPTPGPPARRPAPGPASTPGAWTTAAPVAAPAPHPTGPGPADDLGWLHDPVGSSWQSTGWDPAGSGSAASDPGGPWDRPAPDVPATVAPPGAGPARRSSTPLGPVGPVAGPPTSLAPVAAPATSLSSSAGPGSLPAPALAAPMSDPTALVPVAGPPSAPATSLTSTAGPGLSPRTGERPRPGRRTDSPVPQVPGPASAGVPTGAASAAERPREDDAPAPVPGPASGPVGGRAAARLERQAAEAAARKAGRRGGTATNSRTAPPRRDPAGRGRRGGSAPDPGARDVGAAAPSGSPPRPVQFAIAMVIVALVLLGAWSFGSPATQEASSGALKAGTGATATAPAPSATVPAPEPSAAVPPAEVAPPTPVRAPVTVLNSTGITGLAGSISELIGAGGWELRGTGPYAGPEIAITTVYYTEGDPVQQAAAEQLIEQFPDVSGPAPRFFDVPDVPDPGLVVVATGNWQP